jgi:putative transposase
MAGRCRRERREPLTVNEAGSPFGATEMSHTHSNLLVHVAFSTKGRRAYIDNQIKSELCAYMGGIVRNLHGTALIINGTANHVHMLFRLPADRSLAELVRTVKANSSRWLHERWPEMKLFSWQSGYGAFSVSESNVTAVTEYIANQEEHHRKRSFQEEFISFLKKNGMAYDEACILS